MVALKTTVQNEMLEQHFEADTLKIAWDVLATQFAKTNDARLQLLDYKFENLDLSPVTWFEYSE